MYHRFLVLWVFTAFVFPESSIFDTGRRSKDGVHEEMEDASSYAFDKSMFLSFFQISPSRSIRVISDVVFDQIIIAMSMGLMSSLIFFFAHPD